MPFIGKQSTSNSQITNYTTTVGSGGQSNFTVVIEGGDETHVYLNGVLLKETTDYTVSSTQVSLVSAAVENDIVEIKVFRSFALSDAVRATGGTFSGDVTVPNLTLSSNVIKASDGGSTITLDTSDNVAIAGDLKVGAIKASNGTSGITIASDGQITVNQNNPTITLGSNTTFPAGTIIQVQQQLKNIDNSGADINNPTITAQTFASGFKAHEFSFTPKKSNSKLLLDYRGHIQTPTSNGAEMYFARDNTNSGTDNGTKTRSGSTGNKTANAFSYLAQETTMYHTVSINQMVDASQNTAIRFLVIFTSFDGDGLTIQHDGTSVFTIMEIAQ
tara:strand:+ start:38 stop:1030 length:993 start_codon:yes stop_codon:yes gene_type:complete